MYNSVLLWMLSSSDPSKVDTAVLEVRAQISHM